MNAHFYLNNEQQTEIFSLYDIPVAPYDEGDTINLNVDDLYPSDFSIKIDEEHPVFKKTHQDNENLTNNFHLKKIKIVKKSRYCRFNALKIKSLIVEYYCEFVCNSDTLLDLKMKFLSKKDINSYKWNIETFFEGNYNAGIKPIIPMSLMRLGITNFGFAEYDDKVIITITLIRPGLLIGKEGSTIKKLEEHLSYRPINKPVKISVIESDLWK